MHDSLRFDNQLLFRAAGYKQIYENARSFHDLHSCDPPLVSAHLPQLLAENLDLSVILLACLCFRIDQYQFRFQVVDTDRCFQPRIPYFPLRNSRRSVFSFSVNLLPR